MKIFKIVNKNIEEMFKFNFNNEEEKSEENDTKISSKEIKESKEIKVESNQITEIVENLKSQKVSMFISNDNEIGYLDVGLITGSSETDLIPKIYEGGFKVWECTQDLADYLSCEERNSEFVGKRVCDLGCSAGILGILSLANDAKEVHFQDYNEDVLEKFTIPNVVLYLEENEKLEDFAKCSFFSGDWSSFESLISTREKCYDIILTSETIYNPENYEKLLNFFKAALAKNGKVYLSAKSYYFGVSGNVFDFCKLLESDGTFKCENIWKSDEGLQREILLIKFVS